MRYLLLESGLYTLNSMRTFDELKYLFWWHRCWCSSQHFLSTQRGGVIPCCWKRNLFIFKFQNCQVCCSRDEFFFLLGGYSEKFIWRSAMDFILCWWLYIVIVSFVDTREEWTFCKNIIFVLFHFKRKKNMSTTKKQH